MEMFISQPYQYQYLIVLQDVTAGENWVNGVRDLYYLFQLDVNLQLS